MQTVHIQGLTKKEKVRLIHKLYAKYLRSDPLFHFFFEPDLIIRTTNRLVFTDYLDKRKIEYSIYDYPYPTKKNQYGEQKRYKTIQDDLEELYHLQAKIILKRKNQNLKRFISNRMHHCYLNMWGYEHYDEAVYYIHQAKFYMPHKLTKSLLGLVYKLVTI